MMQTSSLALVAALSALGTLLFLTHTDRSPPHYYRRAQPNYVPAAFHQRYMKQPPPGSHIRPAPGRYVRPPSQVNAHVSYGAAMRQWTTERRKRQGQDCSSDPFSCGEGYYCCEGRCVKAMQSIVTFAADDMGELWICGWMARKTETYTQTATYDGPLPCDTDIYVKATNTEFEGGASIGLTGKNGKKFGSGTTLDVTSQTDFQGPFEPVVPFDALNSTWPYTSLFKEFGALPVKDASNSYAGVTNFRFQVCTT